MLTNIFNRVFSTRNKHDNVVQILLNKLNKKEELIKVKFEKENDQHIRKKQQRSLLVIRAQKKKAEKLLHA